MKNYLLFAAYLFFSAPVWACFHFSKDFRGQLREGKQEFLVFHDGENAHMVLKTELSAEKYPKEIAWVVPFPSVPSKYQEVEGPLFQEIQELFSPDEDNLLAEARDGGFGNVKSAKGIKVHEVVTAGDYKVQPIEILSEDGGEELNQWLTKNKFNPMPKEKQMRYLKKGAAFLAIRMSMNRPNAYTLKSRPLHVTYKSTDISVPLLFTHDGREFDASIYVYTQRENKEKLSRFYLDTHDSRQYAREHKRPILENMIGDKSGWITRYSGTGLNSKNKKLTLLTEDPTFKSCDLLNLKKCP
ncbi:MAG: DUF2330 domain-containing protein [Bdellovibrionaceae bacterium]|nr:DUF2330 domain-containing protein [Pseudobdellovibrionaceae bacterium]